MSPRPPHAGAFAPPPPRGRLLAVLLLALSPLLAAPAHAAPPPDGGRGALEDEFFGGGPEASEVSDEGEGDRGSGAIDEGELARRLEERNDTTVMGGRLYLRLQYTYRDGGDPGSQPLSSPNLLYFYLDARPSDRVRTFAQGRLDYDFTVDPNATSAFGGSREPTRTRLDQLWLKLDIGRSVFLTVGKQRVKWGASRFWNPTDFLNQEHLEPLAIFDERLGVSMLKVHVPIESLGWNLYAFALFDQASTPERLGGAFRMEMLFGLTEVSLSVVGRKEQPLRLGADLSSGVGDLDVRLEAALRHGGSARRWTGSFDPATGALPEEEDRSGAWLIQAAAGLEWGIRYSDQDSLYLAAEYFFNQDGYDDPGLYPWLIAQGDFSPFYLGRHYASLGLLLPGPGRLDDHTFFLSAVGNLSDRSFVARLDYQVQILTFLRLYAFAMVHLGEEGELRFGVDLPPVAAIPGLEKGISLAPPRLDLGLWLSMDL